MPKKVVFKFDENSKITIAELEALGFTFREVPLSDGRIVIIPVEPHLTKRAADVCPADGGKHSWYPNKDNYLIYSCRKCGARG